MAEPNLGTVVDDLVSLMKSEWQPSNTGGDTPQIDKSDALGKGRDLGVFDYVEFSKTSPIDIEDADLTLSSEDFDAAVYAEIKSDDEAKREELFSEFRRIYKDNQKRPDCPANFDRMRLGEVTPLDDSTFGAYLYELTILFEARSRS